MQFGSANAGDLGQTYTQLLYDIDENGETVPTEIGELTKEVLLQINQVNQIGDKRLYKWLPYGDEFIERYKPEYIRADGGGFAYTYGERMRAHFGVDQFETFSSGEQDYLQIWDPIVDRIEASCPCLNIVYPKEKYVIIRSNDMKDAWPGNAEGLDFVLGFLNYCRNYKDAKGKTYIQDMGGTYEKLAAGFDEDRSLKGQFCKGGTIQSNSAHVYSEARSDKKAFAPSDYIPKIRQAAKMMRLFPQAVPKPNRKLVRTPDLESLSDYNNMKGVIIISSDNLSIGDIEDSVEILDRDDSKLARQITNYTTNEDWMDWMKGYPEKKNNVNQIEYVTEKLKEFPVSRRAVITPGDPRTGILMNPQHIQVFDRRGLHGICTLYKPLKDEIEDCLYITAAILEKVSEATKKPVKEIAISLV